MKILKRILLGILGVIVLVLFIALFTKKDYTIQREVVVNKPNQPVYDYTKMFQNQVEFNAWLKMDPDTKTEIRGTDGTVGSVYAWQSEKIGTGEQTTVAMENGRSIDYDLYFKEPMEGHAKNRMTFESIANNQTKIISKFDGRTPYPFNVMHWFMDMDKMIGDNIQSELNDIKSHMEKI
jgi:hypothetical protein